MTVYSKRSSAPTLPATTSPDDTPMPASSPGCSAVSPISSCRSARAVRRARAAWSGCASGAPNTHRAASPSNLFSQPPSAVTLRTTASKTALIIVTTS